MDEIVAKPKRKVVILSITERCNLNCVYCYETAKTKKVMSMQVAKDAINYEFANSDGFDEIEFDLFGGEPTLRRQFIIELVEWTCAQKFAKPFLFFLVTNGTLIHGPFQDWLRKYRQYVCVGLSLDGTPQTHNANRSNSYGKIDIQFFVETYAEQPVRMTINSATVGSLFNDVAWLHELGFKKVDATFASGIDWSAQNITQSLEEQLRQLADYYLAKPNLEVCSIFEMHLPSLVQSKTNVQKWCGTGTSMVTIAADGRKYPCQTFQPNTSEKPIELTEIDFSIIEDLRDPECSKCVLEVICPTCYGMNHAKRGDMLKRDKAMCRLTRLRALATANFKGRAIAEGVRKARDVEPNELYQTIAAIRLLQNSLVAD